MILGRDANIRFLLLQSGAAGPLRLSTFEYPSHVVQIRTFFSPHPQSASSSSVKTKAFLFEPTAEARFVQMMVKQLANSSTTNAVPSASCSCPIPLASIQPLNHGGFRLRYARTADFLTMALVSLSRSKYVISRVVFEPSIRGGGRVEDRTAPADTETATLFLSNPTCAISVCM